MKIGIDLSVAGFNQAGTAVYANSLVDALRQMNTGDEIRLFSAGLRREMASPKTFRRRLDTLYHDVWWMHVLLPWRVHRSGVDLLPTPAGSGFI